MSVVRVDVLTGAVTQYPVDAPAFPRPPVVPQVVRKVALVRALRRVRLDGQPVGPNDVPAWDAFKAALDQQSVEIREDWNLSGEIDRDFPALVAGAEALCPPGQASAILDAVFIAAANQP